MVSSARILTSGHSLRALAVISNSEIVGVVTNEQVKDLDPDILIEKVMMPPPPVFEAAIPVYKAAEILSESTNDFAAIVDDGIFRGMVTAKMLLSELRRPWDARTGLGSGEYLRDWGCDALRTGHEISLLFFDLNDFGQYNKVHGHLIGDKVLRRFATFLKGCIDRRLDILVRYAGDEFAVGTLRHRADAQELAEEITSRADRELFDDDGKPITFCVGISGGRRSVLREGIHPEATYDDLLNNASKACMAAKQELKRRQSQTS